MTNFLTAILLSIIYIEICQRLNLTMVGSRVGEEFVIWPKTGNPEVNFTFELLHILKQEVYSHYKVYNFFGHRSFLRSIRDTVYSGLLMAGVSKTRDLWRLT